MLKVLFIPTMNAGISYYRQWNFKVAMNRLKLADAAMPWFHFLQNDVQQWQFHVLDDPQVYARSGVLNSLVKQADVIIVQYLSDMAGLALIEAFKALYPKKVFLTEIDDYIFDTPPANEAYEQFQPGYYHRNVIVEQIKALDGVVVSTQFLAEAYKEFNTHVYIVPNAVDLPAWDRWPPKQVEHEVRIGWMGGGGHREDLRTIETPLKELLAETKRVRFYCVHGVPDFFKEKSKIVTPKEFKPMNYYPRYIARQGFDIGIAPLVDCNFNRGKSNLRKLEYGAMGIPVVAAKVGHFKETMKHGKDGFLYETPDEFKAYLKLLVEDDSLRKAMGRYNRLDIETNYSTDVVAKHYLQILEMAVAKGQTTKVDVESVQKLAGTTKWIAEQPVALQP